MSYIPFESEVQVVNQVDVLEEPWQLDAYGRLRISSVTTLFESQLSKTTQNRLWHTITTGTALTNYLIDQSSMELNVTNIGDKAIRQSKIYTTARLGKSQLIFLSGNMKPDSAAKKRIGYYDDDNGTFFQMNGTTLELVVRSKATGVVLEDIVPQSAWNIDKLDGTGTSTITLNMDYDQVFAFDIEWMGTGKVRAGLMIDGKMVYVHEFRYSNSSNKPYMSTATLPVRFEIESITGPASLKQTTAVVMTEGGPNEFPNGYVLSNEIAPKQITTALTPVMSIRPKFLNAYGAVNRVSAILEGAEIYSEDDDLYFELKIETSLTNEFFNDVEDASTVEFDYSADSCIGGKVIAKGYTKKGGSVKSIDEKSLAKHLLTVGYDGTDSVTLTLLAKSLNTATADVFSTFSWVEDD